MVLSGSITIITDFNAKIYGSQIVTILFPCARRDSPITLSIDNSLIYAQTQTH
jgi:hypothetical protein